MERTKTIWTTSLFILFLYLAIHIPLLSQYGINWDEPVHYMRGQIFLRYFLTGKKNFNDLPKLRSHYPFGAVIPTGTVFENDSFFRRSIYQYDQDPKTVSFETFVNDGVGHPPLSDILASLSNYIFYQKLGIFGDIASYHLFILFVSSVLVVSVFWFTTSEYGLFSGIVAALAISLYPLFFAEQHFNIKDPVEAAFYTLTILTFYKAVTKQNIRLLLVSAVLAGLALGTKFNIVFAGVTLAIWLLVYFRRTFMRLRWPFVTSMTIVFLLYPIIAVSMLFASWPYLWKDPIGNFLKVSSYYEQIGATGYQPQMILHIGKLAILNSYALQWFVFTTPLVTLLLVAVGVFYALTHVVQKKSKTELLIFLWASIPIIRVSFPQSGIYGGLRQIMEFVAPLAILAGIGANRLAYWLVNYLIKWKVHKLIAKRVAQGFILLLFVPITFKIIQIHPNENVYFNPLIGGLEGAKQRNFPDWGVTLGSVYSQGVKWINENAEQGSTLSLIKGFMSNIPITTLRRDINFVNWYWSGPDKHGEYIMEVTDYYWTRDIPLEKRRYLDTLEPVYEVRVDDVAILTIWKNDWKHTKPSSR